jgi:AbiV
LEDAEILARNNGQISHYVGLYLFALEEFGKLLLLEDSLQSNSVNGQYSVDKTIFGRGQDHAKRRQAHKLKFDGALKTLPSDCGSRCKSKIIKMH